MWRIAITIVLALATMASAATWISTRVPPAANPAWIDDFYFMQREGLFLYRDLVNMRINYCPDCWKSALHSSDCKWHGMQVCEVSIAANWRLTGFRYVTYKAADRRWLSLSIPLWFPTLLLLASTLVSGRKPIRRWLRRKRGSCPKCGYILTGNVSGTCPECGTAIIQE